MIAATIENTFNEFIFALKEIFTKKKTATTTMAKTTKWSCFPLCTTNWFQFYISFCTFFGLQYFFGKHECHRCHRHRFRLFLGLVGLVDSCFCICAVACFSCAETLNVIQSADTSCLFGIAFLDSFHLKLQSKSESSYAKREEKQTTKVQSRSPCNIGILKNWIEMYWNIICTNERICVQMSYIIYSLSVCVRALNSLNLLLVIILHSFWLGMQRIRGIFKVSAYVYNHHSTCIIKLYAVCNPESWISFIHFLFISFGSLDFQFFSPLHAISNSRSWIADDFNSVFSLLIQFEKFLHFYGAYKCFSFGRS